jgi:hypothetical protein
VRPSSHQAPVSGDLSLHSTIAIRMTSLWPLLRPKPCLRATHQQLEQAWRFASIKSEI